jgi:predicted nucleic acid-binding protein
MIVVDASVAVKWIQVEAHSDRALALFDDCMQGGETVLAPPLLPFEIANILRQRMVRQGLPLADADQLMADFLTFPVILLAPAGLYQQAIALADAHRLPAAYDAHYIALAQSSGCDLWTDDRRLIRTLGGALPFVRAIEHYPLP